VAFSPDGSRILTGSIDNTARLWDLQGHEIAIFKGHPGPVYSAVFSPDGSHILTASADKTARLWDLQGREIASFKGHTEAVTNATFSPDGTRVVAASFDGTVLQYFVQLDNLLKVAVCRVGRGLTAEEIARFQVPIPLRFDFSTRRCPPALG
jgi:WD40 repeat protein